MKIVLLQDYQKLGKEGEIVEVKDGYARNFLIPQGIAREATPVVLRELEQKKLLQKRKEEKKLQRLQELKERLAKTSLTIALKTAREDKMYGAVTNIDIARALKEEGFEIDRHKILLEEPIKELGVYQIPIRLHPDIEAKVKVWIVKE
jgi:large subunit ribosomal protein L9